MAIYEQLLEKWHQCKKLRYKTAVIIKKSSDTALTLDTIEEFAQSVNSKIINFEQKYQGSLDRFFTWQTIYEELYAATKTCPIIATELEPFYAKWPQEERLTFLRRILRSEPKHPFFLILTCQEDLGVLRDIKSNERGILWMPSK